MTITPRTPLIAVLNKCTYALCTTPAPDGALLCTKHSDPTYQPTVEEAREQVHQAELRRQQAEAAAKEAERTRAREARKTALRTIFDALVKAINARIESTPEIPRVAVGESKAERTPLTSRDDFFLILESGGAPDVRVNVSEVHRSYGYRSITTGQYAIKFDATDFRSHDPKSFPQKKDGTFSYEKIAQEYVERTLRRQKQQQHRNDVERHSAASAALVEAWYQDLGKTRYEVHGFELDASGTDGTKVKVNVNIKLDEMTPEAARTLYNQLKGLGVVS